MAVYRIRRTVFSAIQWDGTNLTDVQDWFTGLPARSSHYNQFTSVSVTNSSGQLQINYSFGGSQLIQADTNSWLMEGLYGGNASLVIVETDALLDPKFYTVED